MLAEAITGSGVTAVTNWQRTSSGEYRVNGTVEVDDKNLAQTITQIKKTLDYKKDFDAHVRKLHAVQQNIQDKKEVTNAANIEVLNQVAEQIQNTISKMIDLVAHLINNDNFDDNVRHFEPTFVTLPGGLWTDYFQRLSLGDDLLLSLDISDESKVMKRIYGFTIYDKKTGAYISAPLKDLSLESKDPHSEYITEIGFGNLIEDSSSKFPKGFPNDPELNLNFIDLGKFRNIKYLHPVNSAASQEATFVSTHAEDGQILASGLDF